ncbi:uncharacterized protein LOC143041321 [Oratosquilla oratoria]|uniref:uncharacterized protein LOC143041321 n=1 Tax=Oratosquilla oratoria TaxID=337810 RepID=UPI003F76E9AB
MHVGLASSSLLGHDTASAELGKTDLEVLISSHLKSSKQCTEVEEKARKVLGYIRRQFRYLNKEIVLTLCNSLVRPHRKYAVQFWSPNLRMDMEKVERVQARATKLVPAIWHVGYQRRLKELLGLFSPETRRLRRQQINVFKILQGFNNTD